MSYVRIECFGGVEHSRTKFRTVRDSIEFEQVEPCPHQHMSFRMFDDDGPDD